MKTWLKWGLIGGIIYPVFSYVFVFLAFITCYGAPRGSILCTLVKIPYYLFSLPGTISWRTITAFGLQMGDHPLYYSSGYIQLMITISSGIILGFIFGSIIGLIIQKVKR